MADRTRRIPRHILALFAAAVLVMALVAIGLVARDWGATKEPTQASLSPEAVPVSDKQLVLGESIYVSQCAACHGAKLEGQPNWRQRKANGRLPAPPHDESGHTWQHDDATLFNLTKFGLSALVGQPVETDMPIYDGVLTDEQIRSVLAYIKSQWPESIRQRQSAIAPR